MTNRIRRFSPTHIAVLSPSLAGQGAERKALHITAGLLARGHRVDLLLQRLVCHYPEEVPDHARIFFTSGRSDRRTRVVMGRVDTVFRPTVLEPLPWRVRYPRIGTLNRVPRRQYPLLLSTRLPRWAVSIAHHLDRERPDALLAMNVLAASAAAMALNIARHRPRTVATLHEPLKQGRLLRRARHSYPRMDAAVGVSRGVSAEFKKISGLDRERIHVIYNPVVSEHLKRKAGEPVNHPWFDRSDSPVVLAIGKLNERKDFPVLLAAFSRLLTERSARLVVLGEGRMRKRLVSLAKALRISDHVDFPGFQENPYAFLAKADLFVLSSRHEALPTVLIEAMACGCPVVSTDCPFGPREILEDGRLGPLVPVGDAEALAEAMARVLDEPPSRDLLRERASFFSVERAVERYEQLLLGEDGASPQEAHR